MASFSGKVTKTHMVAHYRVTVYKEGLPNKISRSCRISPRRILHRRRRGHQKGHHARRYAVGSETESPLPTRPPKTTPHWKICGGPTATSPKKPSHIFPPQQQHLSATRTSKSPCERNKMKDKIREG